MDIENDLEFLADKEGWEEDHGDEDEGEGEGEGEEGAEGEETRRNGRPSDQEDKLGRKMNAAVDQKRQKKLAKAVIGKKIRDKKINLAFEPAIEEEEDKQLN